MQQSELQERLRRAVRTLETQPPTGGGRRGEKIRRALLIAAKQASDGYRDVCVSASPAQFIERMDFVVSKAKRMSASLTLLVDLEYVDIRNVRDVLVEVRTLQRILTTSRNAAKRRERHRAPGNRRSTSSESRA